MGNRVKKISSIRLMRIRNAFVLKVVEHSKKYKVYEYALEDETEVMEALKQAVSKLVVDEDGGGIYG